MLHKSVAVMSQKYLTISNCQFLICIRLGKAQKIVNKNWNFTNQNTDKQNQKKKSWLLSTGCCQKKKNSIIMLLRNRLNRNKISKKYVYVIFFKNIKTWMQSRLLNIVSFFSQCLYTLLILYSTHTDTSWLIQLVALSQLILFYGC